MTTTYAAVKWPRDATRDEIDRALQTDLAILGPMLMDEHGFEPDRLVELFEDAISSVEWEAAK